MAEVRAPRRLVLKDQGQLLQVEFAGQAPLALPAEYLRVFSPSAEVQGHGPGEPQLVGGKRDVRIKRIDPVGRYAVRLAFDDGHDTGLYTWQTLQEMGNSQQAQWSRYLERLEQHGMSRAPESNVMPLNALRPRKSS